LDVCGRTDGVTLPDAGRRGHPRNCGGHVPGARNNQAVPVDAGCDLAQPARQSAIVAAETEADAREFAAASDPFGLDWKNQSLFACDYLDTTGATCRWRRVVQINCAAGLTKAAVFKEETRSGHGLRR
jgi:hypothetical protein